MKIIDWYNSFESWMFRVFDKIAGSAVCEWLGEGARWAWLLMGFLFGVMSDSFYCASLIGGTVIIAYAANIGKEWKLRGSYLVCVLILVLAFAGYGLVELLTEK